MTHTQSMDVGQGPQELKRVHLHTVDWHKLLCFGMSAANHVDGLRDELEDQIEVGLVGFLSA